MGRPRCSSGTKDEHRTHISRAAKVESPYKCAVLTVLQVKTGYAICTGSAVIKCDHLSIPALAAAMFCCWTADAGSELEHSSAKKRAFMCVS